MKEILKAELYKMLRCRLLWMSATIGVVCAITSGVYMSNLYYSNLGPGGILAWLKSQGDAPKENNLAMMTLFTSWMNAEKLSIGARVFFLLTPVLAALPCGWSFSEEIHSGYLRIVVSRGDRKTYFSYKVFVSFVTGGALIVLPQMLNFWFISMQIPGVRPNVIYNLYASVEHGDIFSNIFYRHPLCYVFLILCIDFLFGGLFALMSLASAFFVSSRLAAVIIPFIFLLVVDSCRSFFYYISYIEISPIEIVHPITATNYVQLPVVLLWAAVLFLLTVPLIIIKGCSLEIL